MLGYTWEMLFKLRRLMDNENTTGNSLELSMDNLAHQAQVQGVHFL